MGRGSRDARIQLGVDDRHLDGSLTSSGRRVKRWGGKVAADLNRSMRGAFSSLSDVAGFAGIAGLAVAAKQVLEFETRLTRLQISSRSTAGAMAKLRDRIFQVAQLRGVSSDQLLGGLEQFVALTGDIDTAAGALDTFALVAAATGARMEDISVTAAALRTNMGVTAAQMEQAFGILLVQGKSGAVELKDLSGIVAGLTPQFSQFGNVGTAGLAEMGALLQVMRAGFGSAAETATGLSSLMTAMVKNAKNLRRIGVNPFEKDGKTLRNMTDVVFDLIKRSKGNPEVLQKVLGRAEAFQALLPLMQKGRAEVEKLIEAGAMGSAELQKDFATFAETPAAKLAQVKAQLEGTFNESLAKVLPVIAKAFEKIASAIGFIADHPTEVLAALALLKGGSIAGGLGASLLGPGGGGVSAMADPKDTPAIAAAKRQAQFANRVAGGLQGAAIGLSVGALLEKNLGLGGVEKAAITTAHAMAGMLGPIGLVTAALGDALLFAINALISKVDEREKKIIASPFSGQDVDRARRAGRGVSEAAPEMTDPKMRAAFGLPPLLGGGGTLSDRDAFSILNQAERAGALTTKNGAVTHLDEKKLRAKLAGSDLSAAEQESVVQSVLDAVWSQGGKALFQESKTTTPMSPHFTPPTQEPIFPEPLVFGPGLGSEFFPGKAPDGAQAPGQAPPRLTIKIEPAPGFKIVADNDPTIRRE